MVVNDFEVAGVAVADEAGAEIAMIEVELGQMIVAGDEDLIRLELLCCPGFGILIIVDVEPEVRVAEQLDEYMFARCPKPGGSRPASSGPCWRYRDNC